MTALPEASGQIVDFIHGLRLNSVPVEVVEQAKFCLLDLIGACIAGCHAGGAAILLSFVQSQFHGPAEATVIGAGCQTSCVSAALVNGFIANALDIDDGHRICKGHPGAVIFPAILAVAEKSRAGGSDFLKALIVGYEISIRVGPLMHQHYGYYHGSGSWSAVGAAAAVAAMLRLNPEQTLNALAIAESYAPLAPVMRSVASPAMAPKDGVPWGAMTGLSAALLARDGYTGSPGILNDPDFDREALSLGRVWKMMQLYFKPYPCCRWSQPAVDAAVDLMQKANIETREISRVIIYTFAEAAALFRGIPRDLESAQYSLRFPVAVAIVCGDFTPAHLNEIHYKNEAVLNIFDLIETRIDPEIQDQFPKKCLSRVEIHLKSGRVADSGLTPARGDWDDRPLSREELETKFLAMTRSVWTRETARELIRLVRSFENCRISELIPYLA